MALTVDINVSSPPLFKISDFQIYANQNFNWEVT